jgi:hypothetical protein
MGFRVSGGACRFRGARGTLPHVPGMPPLAPSAAARLERLRNDGHTVHWGRGSDGRSGFYWARVTPRHTAIGRNVRAGDGDALITKVEDVVRTDAPSHVIAALSDPFRSCVSCQSELSFDGDGRTVFACPRATGEPGHTVITAI